MAAAAAVPDIPQPGSKPESQPTPMATKVQSKGQRRRLRGKPGQSFTAGSLFEGTGAVALCWDGLSRKPGLEGIITRIQPRGDPLAGG